MKVVVQILTNVASYQCISEATVRVMYAYGFIKGLKIYSIVNLFFFTARVGTFVHFQVVFIKLFFVLSHGESCSLFGAHFSYS